MNKDSILRILLIIIVILLMVNIVLLSAWGVITIVLGNSDSAPSRPAGRPSETQKETDDLPVSGNPDASALLGESADMGQGYIDSMIFLGDSTTYHLKSRGVLRDGKDTKQVWSGSDVDESGKVIPAGTLTLDGRITSAHIYYPRTGESLTVAQALEKEKPEYLVITLGVNGISYVNLDDSKSVNNFISCYKALVNAARKASPDTKIILQSIFPVTEAYSQNGNGITNEKIDAANTWILQLAKDTGCKYLDSASVLKNGSGALSAVYDNGDGYHLTADAYRAVLQYIRTHGYTD